MEKKHKVYIKLNLMSLFFIAVSFISVSLAWFAYSGLTSVKAEFGVKAWYIEFSKGTSEASNNIEISLPDIEPGMNTKTEIVDIKNLGDDNAQLEYEIVQARILNTEYIVGQDGMTSEKLEDMLSHDYPFSVNINLSKNYVLNKTFAKTNGNKSVFNVSISWPLDSGTDSADSNWGKNAYDFQVDEASRSSEEDYVPRAPIKIDIKVTAEQYIESTPTAIDTKYNLGDLVLYDVKKNHGCTEVKGSCIRTHVIDINSTVADETVRLLPDLFNTYPSSTFADYKTTLARMFDGIGDDDWNVLYEELSADILMKIISRDIFDSVLIRNNLSNSIIGSLNFPNRMATELTKATIPRRVGDVDYYGYYLFNSSPFEYLVSNKCYWTNTEFNSSANTAFAFSKNNDSTGKIYGESKDTNCSVIPVLKVYKGNVERTTD